MLRKVFAQEEAQCGKVKELEGVVGNTRKMIVEQLGGVVNIDVS